MRNLLYNIDFSGSDSLYFFFFFELNNLLKQLARPQTMDLFKAFLLEDCWDKTSKELQLQFVFIWDILSCESTYYLLEYDNFFFFKYWSFSGFFVCDYFWSYWTSLSLTTVYFDFDIYDILKKKPYHLSYFYKYVLETNFN